MSYYVKLFRLEKKNSSICSIFGFKKENPLVPILPVQNIDKKNSVCRTEEYFTTPKIVFLETKEKSIIGLAIRKIILEEDKIFLQDQYNNSILMFDTTG